MRKINVFNVLVMVLIGIVLTACEKANWEEDGKKTPPNDAVHVVFHVTHFKQVAFDDDMGMTKASVNVDQICTQINLAAFKDGAKVKSVSQKAGSEHFGTIAADLPKGTYKIVIVAHSCKGAATITSPEKISFPDNKLTDTFYYCTDVTVGDAATYDVELKRAVSMFRLITEDNVPSQVASMRFYYTGGSSALDAVTGLGCVKSRQTEVRTVDAAAIGKPGQFEVYTFPHAETGELKMTVTALDAAGNAVKMQTFAKVPVKRNVITQYSGKFFGDLDPSSSSSFVLTANNTWQQSDYRY